MKKLTELVKQVRIMGVDCKVNYQEGLDRGQNFGTFDPFNNLISISDDSDISEQQKLQVLLHECIEAINFKLELHLDHPQISGIETGLYQVLADNPDLIYAFMEAACE